MSKKNRQHQKRRKYWRKHNRHFSSGLLKDKKQRGLWRRISRNMRPLDILTSDWFYRKYMDKMNEDLINKLNSEFMMSRACLEGAKMINSKVMDETIKTIFERKMANYCEENGLKQDESWVKKGMIGLKSGLKWG